MINIIGYQDTLGLILLVFPKENLTTNCIAISPALAASGCAYLLTKYFYMKSFLSFLFLILVSHLYAQEPAYKSCIDAAGKYTSLTVSEVPAACVKVANDLIADPERNTSPVAWSKCNLSGYYRCISGAHCLLFDADGSILEEKKVLQKQDYGAFTGTYDSIQATLLADGYRDFRQFTFYCDYKANRSWYCVYFNTDERILILSKKLEVVDIIL